MKTLLQSIAKHVGGRSLNMSVVRLPDEHGPNFISAQI
jgi:hypothetical protein